MCVSSLGGDTSPPQLVTVKTSDHCRRVTKGAAIPESCSWLKKMERWTELIVVAVVTYTILQSCVAVEEQLKCNVTQDGQRTKYSVLHDFADFPTDLSRREYSFSNESNVVLANETHSIDPVTTHSINTLVSSECIPTVHFIATSYSKLNTVETEYTSTCSINCSDSTLSPVTGTGTKIALGVLIPLTVLVAGLLCYRFKDRFPRMRFCSMDLH